MTISLSHLDMHEWVCEILLPNEPRIRCTGKVQYNPENGISFEMYLEGGAEAFLEAKCLYGISYDIGKFTLKGCASLSTSSTQVLTKVKMFAICMIVGGHFSDDDSFVNSKFTVNNLEGFSSPLSRLESINSGQEVILRGEFKDNSISIKKTNYGHWIKEGAVSDTLVFAVNDDNAKARNLADEINDSFSKILKKHEPITVFSKSSTIYECFIEPKEEQANINSFISCTKNMVDLFSILMLTPCMVKDIAVAKMYLHSNQERYIHYHPVLVSYHHSGREQNAANIRNWSPYSDVSALDLKECFQETLCFWEELLGSALDLTRNVIREHIKDDYNIVQHSVICISALEQWFSNYEEEKGNKKKYDYMVDKYATEYMQAKLKGFLSLEADSKDNIGKTIGDIRNAILHPNNTRRTKFNNGRGLSEVILHNLTEIIIMILIRALFTRFGVPQDAVNKYGGHGSEVLREHYFFGGEKGS